MLTFRKSNKPWAPLIVRAVDTIGEALAAVDIMFEQMVPRHEAEGSGDHHAWDYAVDHCYLDVRPAIALANDAKQLRQMATRKLHAPCQPC